MHCNILLCPYITHAYIINYIIIKLNRAVSTVSLSFRTARATRYFLHSLGIYTTPQPHIFRPV